MNPAQRSAAALAAATAVNLPFGTLYAFSVLLKPMEALLGATRAEMSFVFGLATVTLTLGMNFAPRLYRRLSPVTLAAASGCVSGAGLWLAAGAQSFSQFALGYGVLFGPGAGVLFTVAQQAVNQTVTGRRGLANGYVVSLYPLGAMLGAPALGWSIEAFGVRAALGGLGVVVLAACIVAAALFRAADIRMQDASSAADEEGALGRTFYLLTAVFFFAAAAGLTVLSQAAAIVQAYGGAAAFAVGATTFITGAVGAARIAGGWLVDHFAAARVGAGAHLCSLAGGLLLGLVPGPAAAAVALGLIGIGYG
ncbi:MAG: MFS transporter, partial [Pseudomonadota bacterium]